MDRKGGRPKTAAAYIAAAPAEGRAHLKKLHAILKKAAPKAKVVIKWGNPFFVEPRFLYAYSAHKAHVSLAPGSQALDPFRAKLKGYAMTKYFLKIRYDQEMPVKVIQQIAKYQVAALKARKTDGFWSGEGAM